MTRNAHLQPNSEHTFDGLIGTIDPPSYLEQLVQENGCLRVIVAELLVKNQNLRWALQLHPQDPRLWLTSEGTPLRRNSLTADIP